MVMLVVFVSALPQTTVVRNRVDVMLAHFKGRSFLKVTCALSWSGFALGTRTRAPKSVVSPDKKLQGSKEAANAVWNLQKHATLVRLSLDEHFIAIFCRVVSIENLYSMSVSKCSKCNKELEFINMSRLDNLPL